MSRQDIKKILMEYFSAKQVDTLLPTILEVIPENSSELCNIDVDELFCILDNFANENDGDVFDYEFSALVDQLTGILPVERPNPYKPETVKVNVSKENAKVWLKMRPEYSYGQEFLEILRDALNKNLGSFEVPIGNPYVNEFARLIFIPEAKRLRFNYYQVKDLAKKNGVVLGDKYYWVLYITYLMNAYLKKSGEIAENIFDAVCADDDCIGDKNAVEKIRKEIFVHSWNRFECMLNSTDDEKVTTVSMPFMAEKFYDKYWECDTAFYIIP